MEDLRGALRAYGLEQAGAERIAGGLSAAAYAVRDGRGRYFLKAYDRRDAQTRQWTERIALYMPVLARLAASDALRGRIVRPVPARDGAYSVQDGERVYILFDFVPGRAAGFGPMTRAQTLELAETMALLHGQAVPPEARRLEADGSLTFCDALEGWLADGFTALPADAAAVLRPCREPLLEKTGRTRALAPAVERSGARKVLCHTDAHGMNLIQGERLVLVDWEGLALAPAEADLFMFAARESWPLFLARYRAVRPDAQVSAERLAFYACRRKLEDVAAFLERVVQPGLPGAERAQALAYLAAECRDLEAFCF